jgi:hypothetical protein
MCAMPKRGQFLSGQVDDEKRGRLHNQAVWQKSASVALLSGKCRRRSDGVLFAQSSSIPGSKDFGLILEPSGRWTGLQSTASVQGLFYKVSGLGCNLILSRGPQLSCTEMQNE